MWTHRGMQPDVNANTVGLELVESSACGGGVLYMCPTNVDRTSLTLRHRRYPASSPYYSLSRSAAFEAARTLELSGASSRSGVALPYGVSGLGMGIVGPEGAPIGPGGGVGPSGPGAEKAGSAEGAPASGGAEMSASGGVGLRRGGSSKRVQIYPTSTYAVHPTLASRDSAFRFSTRGLVPPGGARGSKCYNDVYRSHSANTHDTIPKSALEIRKKVALDGRATSTSTRVRSPFFYTRCEHCFTVHGTFAAGCSSASGRPHDPHTCGPLPQLPV